jgi:glycerol-3-phosphate acyltransferase PlsY
MTYLIIATVCYLIGSFSPSIHLTQLIKGQDIRTLNSKNAGASNTTLTIGLKWGVVVFLVDLLKGALPILLIKWLYPSQDIFWFVGAFFVLIGHVFPIYHQFKGGKGTSTYLGIILGIFPILGLVLFGALISVTIITDYVVFGTLALLFPPPIYMFIINRYDWRSLALILIFISISLYKHSNNFYAIYKGDEKGLKEALKKS